MSPLILRMKLDYAETEIGAHEMNRLLGRIDLRLRSRYSCSVCHLLSRRNTKVSIWNGRTI